MSGVGIVIPFGEAGFREMGPIPARPSSIWRRPPVAEVTDCSLGSLSASHHPRFWSRPWLKLVHLDIVALKEVEKRLRSRLGVLFVRPEPDKVPEARNVVTKVRQKGALGVRERHLVHAGDYLALFRQTLLNRFGETVSRKGRTNRIAVEAHPCLGREEPVRLFVSKS